jgi:hypothetical protein
MTHSAWRLHSALVPFPGGGIVHAYPEARFIGTGDAGENHITLVFLDRDPTGNTVRKRPNADEVEFQISIYGCDEDIASDAGVIGVLSREHAAYVVIARPAN